MIQTTKNNSTKTLHAEDCLPMRNYVPATVTHSFRKYVQRQTSLLTPTRLASHKFPHLTSPGLVKPGHNQHALAESTVDSVAEAGLRTIHTRRQACRLAKVRDIFTASADICTELTGMQYQFNHHVPLKLKLTVCLLFAGTSSEYMMQTQSHFALAQHF